MSDQSLQQTQYYAPPYQYQQPASAAGTPPNQAPAPGQQYYASDYYSIQRPANTTNAATANPNPNVNSANSVVGGVPAAGSTPGSTPGLDYQAQYKISQHYYDQQQQAQQGYPSGLAHLSSMATAYGGANTNATGNSNGNASGSVSGPAGSVNGTTGASNGSTSATSTPVPSSSSNASSAHHLHQQQQQQQLAQAQQAVASSGLNDYSNYYPQYYNNLNVGNVAGVAGGAGAPGNTNPQYHYANQIGSVYGNINGASNAVNVGGVNQQGLANSYPYNLQQQQYQQLYSAYQHPGMGGIAGAGGVGAGGVAGAGVGAGGINANATPAGYLPSQQTSSAGSMTSSAKPTPSTTPVSSYTITDSKGQIAPPGIKPKVTTTLWEDENTLCFQVEARGICVARREDNDFINGTKLLNVAGMTRGRRDGILKGEKIRHVVKAGAMHLKGVWIPYDRGLEFANKEKIIDLLYPLFVTDIKSVLYHPNRGLATGNSSNTSAIAASNQQQQPQQPQPQTQQQQHAGVNNGQGGLPNYRSNTYDQLRLNIERSTSTPPVLGNAVPQHLSQPNPQQQQYYYDASNVNPSSGLRYPTNANISTPVPNSTTTDAASAAASHGTNTASNVSPVLSTNVSKGPNTANGEGTPATVAASAPLTTAQQQTSGYPSYAVGVVGGAGSTGVAGAPVTVSSGNGSTSTGQATSSNSVSSSSGGTGDKSEPQSDV